MDWQWKRSLTSFSVACLPSLEETWNLTQQKYFDPNFSFMYLISQLFIFPGVCRPCMEKCHKVHTVVPYIMSHQPTWYVLYAVNVCVLCDSINTDQYQPKLHNWIDPNADKKRSMLINSFERYFGSILEFWSALISVDRHWKLIGRVLFLVRQWCLFAITVQVFVSGAMIRERSKFTGGGKVGSFPEIACTGISPPPRSLCTKILTPPRQT